jgi:integrase
MRKVKSLSAVAVKNATTPGMYPDGDGLYLRVSDSGAKSWIWRYQHAGKRHDMGIGPLSLVGLAEAREIVTEYRRKRRSGIDPLAEREAERARARLEAAKVMTFRACAEAYVDGQRSAWKNEKHAAQWTATLATYAYPVFGDLPVQAIDTGLVLKALEPIWATKTETASRLRGRIESVLDWARVRQYREGENPARWKGHLAEILPERSKIQKVEHHAALPYAEVAGFIAELRETEAISARAFEFLILTATRTGETIGARWSEIDLEKGLWTIPAGRIKAGKEHRVPLSGAALEIVKEMQAMATSEFVFPGIRPKKPLSNMALLQLLKRMERPDLTAHGFRSTFRDWAAEATHYPREVAEIALAHTIGDKVEAAYRRGDLMEKRRALMEDWARQCGVASAENAW